MWLGPPFMNSQIRDLALAGKCPGRALSGSAGSSPAALALSRSASASMPRPPPARASSPRLVQAPALRSRLAVGGGVRSVDIDELVQAHQHLAVVGEGERPGLVGRQGGA